MSEQTIAAFYYFGKMEELEKLKTTILDLMHKHQVVGTFILAEEGYNTTISGPQLDYFLNSLRRFLPGNPKIKFSKHSEPIFKRSKVKIKKEIVTLRKDVDMELASGSHIAPEDWDDLIDESDVLLIDTRNDYEFRLGTFKGAVNPKIEKFSDLPDYLEERYPPGDNPRIATFCTGGIRCEKLVPHLKELGYNEVYQLDGGILGYFQDQGNGNDKWQGDCFVFDERVSVNDALEQGSTTDYSNPGTNLDDPESETGEAS